MFSIDLPPFLQHHGYRGSIISQYRERQQADSNGKCHPLVYLTNGPVTLGRIDLYVQETNVIHQCSFFSSFYLCPVIIRQMRSC